MSGKEKDKSKTCVFALCEKIDLQQKAYKRELRALPKGTLRGRLSGKRYYYTQKIGGREKSVTESEEIIAALCRKKYVKENIQRIEKVREKLEVVMSEEVFCGYLSMEDFCKNLPPCYQNLPRKYFENPTGLEAWASEPYRQNTMFVESKIHPTAQGILMRSKGESIIGTLFEKQGIVFRYDEVIERNGYILSPDFSIKRKSDGKVVYLEHFGMITEDSYIRKVGEKLSKYSAMGLSLWKDLFLSFEYQEGSIDVEGLNNLIRDYFS